MKDCLNLFTSFNELAEQLDVSVAAAVFRIGKRILHSMLETSTMSFDSNAYKVDIIRTEHLMEDMKRIFVSEGETASDWGQLGHPI